MTTFISEDRIESEKVLGPTPEQIQYNDWQVRWGKNWVDAVKGGWNIQKSIEYFWPLTQQIDLGLDFTGCENLKYTYSGITGSSGQTFMFNGTGATWTTNINPSLSVSAVDSVGELRIGGISIGLDTKPNIMRRALHRLLGFDWKDK